LAIAPGEFLKSLTFFPQAWPLLIDITSMSYKQHNDPLFMLMNLVHNPPITNSITEMSGQRAFETFDIRMLIWIILQVLETAMQLAHQNRISLFVEMLRLFGQKDFIHRAGCP